MKYCICYIITDLVFVKFMLREVGLFILGYRSLETTINNLKWIHHGGYEYECWMNKLKDIPCEISFEYLDHLYSSVYGD